MNRPTSVTVFGILNIVFAALGIFGIAASALMLVAAGNGTSNPVVQLLRDSPGYAAYVKVSIALGLVVSLALLAAGVGLLFLQPWARVVSIAYGIFGIVSVPVNTALSYIFITQPMLAQMHHGQSGPEAAGAIGGMVGGMIGGCFGLVYPVLLLIFMLKANVTAAFKAPAGGADLPNAGQA